MRNSIGVSKLVAVAALVGLFSGIASAQWKPAQELRIVNGFAPGGGGDILCRIMAAALEPVLGKSVIVENKAGANGFIAAEYVTKAKPDGHTVVFVTMAMLTVSPYIPGNSVPIDVDKSLTPIGALADIPIIAVTHANAPFGTMAELIARAKANRGKMSYGSGGVGSIGHLSGELMNSMAGTDLLHVSYRGGAPAMVDLIAGRLDLMIGNMPDFMGAIADKRVKPIAFAGTEPKPQIPGLPLVSATLPGFVSQNWFAFMGPPGMDPDAVKTWTAALGKVLSDPETRAKLDKAGFFPLTGQTAELQRLIADDRKRWQKVIADSGIKLQQ
jgi:tripartite-type tricarboxylate transporter receptor subunit TctC